jgi:cob(I)alamin adenosyltransferase
MCCAWLSLRGRAVHQGAWDTGERRLLTGHFGELCQFHAMGEGFTWETQDRARDVAAAKAGWEKAKH